ncbi:MAG: Arginine-binding extracellular protein ArtP [Chlamydiae bacterium]|nr:Arginine-binding extracellular protein ArtP [Chlamydiota bacterium]
MHRHVKIVLSLIIFFVTAIFLNGCGTTEKNKIYKIGRDRSWYPLNMLGKEKNMLAFTDDLIYTIAENEGFKVDLESASQNALTENLQRGVFDAIVTFRRPTDKLLRSFEFSEPFFLLGPVLVVPIYSSAKSLEDMKNKVVGIQTGASVVYNIERVPKIIFTPFENILFAMRNLAEDQIDGVIMEALPAHEYVESFYKGELKIVPPPLTHDGIRLMALRDPVEEDLLNRFNEGLKKVKADGTFQVLIEKWGLFDPESYTGEIIPTGI